MRRGVVIIIIAIIIAGGGYLFLTARNLPNLNLLNQRQVNQSTKIFDRTGKIILYEIYGEEKRTVIPFSEIPEQVKQATLVIEDSQFYEHSAFDWRSILRALLINLSRGQIAQGGSTITQQLAKNAFLNPEKTITRKIKELILAFKLEKRYSKDEIFWLYLNQIPYGSNAYGIEAAAQTFFAKSAKDLSYTEAALLASLPRAPSYYSPAGSHLAELLARKDYILEQMTLAGYLGAEELKRAKEEKLSFQSQTRNIKAPHFVITIQEYLNKKYGEDFIRKAGLRVISTLDWPLQQLAEKVVAEGAERNIKLYKGGGAALVAQDGKTGQILALVGSKDYFNTDDQGNFNVATQGLRQPGSAIKPIAYITAFKKGYTLETVVFDVETDFETISGQSYSPRNFDNRYRGPVTFREALAQSINVPSVKVLYLAGVDETLKTAANFGITTLTERSRYGLSLALGGGEVKLIELVGAYSVFSQEGLKHQQSLILEITDGEGAILEKYQDEVKEVIEPEYTWLINDILSDAEARRPLYQNSFNLTTFPNQEVALKTGTTNEYHDAWSVGYNPSLVVGVWVGNNDNQPMQQQGSSILAALPIWHAFISEALKDRPLEVFTRPRPAAVDKPILNGDYLINNEVHEILYYVNKDDPRGPEPKNPERDPQFQNWEKALSKWLQENQDFLKTQTAKGHLEIAINKPLNGEFIDRFWEIKAQIKSDKEINSLEILFNDQLIERRAGDLGKIVDYQKNLSLEKLDYQNKLVIRAADSRGKEEKTLILYRH